MASEATLTVSSSKKRRNRRDRRRLKMIRNSVDRPDTPTKLEPQVGVTPPLLNSPELQLRYVLLQLKIRHFDTMSDIFPRFLNPGDLPEVKRLCREWFPIEYPDTWYADITSTQKFYSVAAIFRGQIVGLIVAEIKDSSNLPKEDKEILANSLGLTKIGYILSLGIMNPDFVNKTLSFDEFFFQVL